MQFAICNEMFEGWSWKQTCHFAAGLGYDAIELAPFTVAADVRELSSEERTRLYTEARQAGLSIVGLHWLLVKPPGLHLTSPDAAVRKTASEYLLDLVRFCGDLSGKVMVLGSPRQRSIAPGIPRQEAVEWLCEILDPVSAAAAALGITLCLEPLPAEDTNFLNTLAEVAEIVRTLNHSGLRLILDVKSMGSEGTPISDLVRAYGPLASHVHANDTNRRGPGDGDTDYVPIFQALHDIRYTGAVSVEVFDYTPDPQTIARNSLEYMKRIWGIVDGQMDHR